MTDCVPLQPNTEIKIAFCDHPLSKKTLQIVRKISEGKLEVYEVYSSARKSRYALKVFPKTQFGTEKYQNEKLMISLSHKNVIQSVPIICQDTRFYALLTEFAEHGDFFELITRGVINSELLIRTYFHQLIEGLEYIHSNALAHLDLKLENLMLGSDYKLKIIDFDQAQPIVESRILSKGTFCSRAPEVLYGTCQNLAAADIYSAGVILFAMKAGGFPFLEIPDQQRGRHLKSSSMFIEDNRKFWQIKSQTKGAKSFFSTSFIELMNGMLEFKVEKRFKIADIKKSKWYRKPTLDDESLAKKMRSRLEEMSQRQVQTAR